MERSAQSASKVLIVDDEEGYCRKLARYFSAHGYQIATATNGEDAVSIGSRLHPQLLVTDWMLRGQIHGLHVIDAIRTVFPDTRTVMMTAFASSDLREEAAMRDVSAFIEKPFSPEQLGDAVDHAMRSEPPAQERGYVALIVTGSDRRVVHANDATVRFLGRKIGDLEPLANLFAPGSPPDWTAARHRWVAATLATPSGDSVCRLRVRRFDCNDQVVLLCKQEYAETLSYDHSMKLLIGDTQAGPIRWNLAGHGLVVDPSGSARSLVCCVFEEMGSLCHAADSFARAVEIFEKDREIRYVIIDCAAGDEITEFVDAVKTRRPDCTILGQCEIRRDELFLRAGIENIIRKPWSVSDFVGALVSHE